MKGRVFRNHVGYAVAFLALSCLVSSCAIPVTQGRANQPSVPVKAIVTIVVDQLGAEQLSQYTPQHGIKDLSTRGFFSRAARYEYLHPETCPGHATVATGTYPWKHGIVQNSWFDESVKKEVYCVANREGEISAERLLRPTLSDILTRFDYDPVTISVSGKDRSAVTLAGRSGDIVLWYNSKRGVFESSRAFPLVPPIVAEFNKSTPWRPFFDAPWEPLSHIGEGGTLPSFSIPLGYSLTPDSEFFGALYQSPALDELTVELFERVVRDSYATHPEKLHLLSLSLSALDIVGHRWGSMSAQYRDTLLRVDVIVARVLDLLRATFGEGQFIVALTGDHGAFLTEMPGNRSVSGGELQCARRGERCPGLEERLCYDALSPHSRWFNAARHSFFPGRSEACTQVYAENLVPYLGSGTSHVTPHPIDTDVPLMIAGPGVTPRTTSGGTPASIVPTILSVLGILDEAEREYGSFDGPNLIGEANAELSMQN